MLEGGNQRAIWLAAGLTASAILFRANTGVAWVAGAGRPRRVGGDMVLPGARPVTLGFGLANGKPAQGVGDLQGWRSVVITPEMVGCRIAVYCSVETKRTDGGRTTVEQYRWRDTIIAAGGMAIITGSADECVAYIKSWRPPKVAT